MLEKIRAVLALGGMFLPAGVKCLLLEVGAELDRLRAEINQVNSNQPKE